MAIIGAFPNTISNGQAIDAVPVMADFNWIQSQVNTNAAGITQANVFTLVQSGVGATAAANFPIASQIQSQGLTQGGTAGGSANALTLTPSVPISGYVAGQEFIFTAGFTNTTAAPTIAISGLAALPTVMGNVALPIGGIIIGNIYLARVEADLAHIRVAPYDAASTNGDTYTGRNDWAKGAAIASAATVDLTAATGNLVHITGSVTITAFTINQGQWLQIIFDGAPLLTNGAGVVLPSGANIQAAAGDRCVIWGDAANTANITEYTRADGTPVISPAAKQIFPIATPTVAGNALTLGTAAMTLDFRNATLANGPPIAGVSVSALTLTVPSGASLGVASGVQAQLVLIIAYNGGSPVLCVTNLAGVHYLDETGLISPTTISAGATSPNVIYSASAVGANSPYRVVGFVYVTEAASGTWATAPSTTQGVGGQALVAMNTFGFGQNWANVTGSRAVGTTYYNTFGRPLMVVVTMSSAPPTNFVVNGVTLASTAGAQPVTFVVPPGMGYSVSAGTTSTWYEMQ